MKRGSRFLLRRPFLQYPAYRFATLIEQVRANLPTAPKRLLASGNSILIIMGSGRSGNTLLRRLLMERGAIFIPPESYVWSAVVRSTLQSPGLSWQDRVSLVLGKFEYSAEFDTFDVSSLRAIASKMLEWPSEKRSVGEIIRGLYFGLAEHHHHPVAWVGEKTPMNLARAGLVAQMFPNAKYVYLERDGVDVAVSYRAAGIYPTLEEGARRWMDSRAAWSSFKRQLDPASFVELAYDRLTNSHVECCEGILGKFHIPVRASPIDVQHLMGDVPKRPHHEAARRPGVQNAPGNARALLAKEEREVLRTAFGRELVQAGYEPL